MTLLVQGLAVEQDAANSSINGLDLTITVQNNGGSTMEFAPDDLAVKAGNNQYTRENRALTLVDASGNSVTCINVSFNVAAGSSVTDQHVCYLPDGGDPTGQDITLQWAHPPDGTVTLDLGQPS